MRGEVEGVDMLHVSTVDVKPVQVDWSGESEDGEYAEPRPFWEAFTYEHDETETTHTLVASGGSTLAVVIDGTAYESFDDYADAWRDEHGGDDDDDNPDALTEETFEELLAVAPYMYGAEGPMMNYWYAIEESDGAYRWSFDPVAAAAKLADLPLCVVEIDGEYGLALTGGGMDLSWEICAAFVALGKLPPVHFRDLPAYAREWTERDELVYHAMRRSLEVCAGWMTSGIDRLGNMRAQMSGGSAR